MYCEKKMTDGDVYKRQMWVVHMGFPDFYSSYKGVYKSRAKLKNMS